MRADLMSNDLTSVVEIGEFSANHLYKYFELSRRLRLLYHVSPSDGRVYLYSRVSRLEPSRSFVGPSWVDIDMH